MAMATNDYSRPLHQVELIHFGVGFAIGVFFWLRPWVQLAGLAFVLWKELLRDPRRWTPYRNLWSIPRGFYEYRWGPGYQVIDLREKGVLDLACYFAGMLAGMIFFEALK